jgi:GNAT superfamily N-acetyltransferase
MISYHHGRRPDVHAIAVLYACAPLRRPVDDLARLEQMYAGSNVVITAYEDERLVGILRGWTDGAYDGYICDLAIHPDYQKSGIGRELLNRATARNPGATWILIASPLAEKYYEHVGWTALSNGWKLGGAGSSLSYDEFKQRHQGLRAQGGLDPA